MRRAALVLLSVTLLFGACGSPSRDASPGSDGTTVSPEEPVSNTPDPDAPVPASTPSYVEPKPGQADVRPIGWDDFSTRGPKTLEVVYWSGIEPCYVLDHVEVEETARRVTITAFEGHTETEEDVACIEIAVQKAFLVELAEPLGKRKVFDGSAPSSPPK